MKVVYVKTEDLKVGMRLARPIYNKRGILLYGRDDRITKQGIESVRNFGLMGLYVLEPAEPLPPMSEEEIEFERFQTMALFSLRDDLDAIVKGEEPNNIIKQTDEIVRKFGNLYHKINFNQNIRSIEDYVYKHSLNVAILCALISHKAGMGIVEQTEIVIAALLHDVGKLSLGPDLRGKTDNFKTEEMTAIARAAIIGVDKITQAFDMPPVVKSILMQFCQVQYLSEKDDNKISKAVKILIVAKAYDEYTSMQLDKNPYTEIEAVRMLQNNKALYDSEVVSWLLNSIKILYPGVCVELTNQEKGLVLRENTKDVLRPTVLSFSNNQIYNLEMGSVFEKIQIKNLMKTMDNRIKVDQKTLQEYL